MQWNVYAKLSITVPLHLRPHFLARPDRIMALVEQAAPGANSVMLLAEAYTAGCTLEGDAKARGSITEVEHAPCGHKS